MSTEQIAVIGPASSEGFGRGHWLHAPWPCAPRFSSSLTTPSTGTGCVRRGRARRLTQMRPTSEEGEQALPLRSLRQARLSGQRQAVDKVNVRRHR